jgi:NNP family nitrate/nitrite transporter-like MFS transporter
VQTARPIEPEVERGAESARGHPLSAVLGSVLLLTGIFFLTFVARVGLGPLMPMIEADLGMSHADAGSVFLFLSSGYCAGLLLSGFVSARINHRWTVVLATTAGGTALLGVSLGGGPAALRAGVVGLGLAAGLYLPSGIAIITALVKPAHWGKALAVHELAPNLSFAAAPLLAEGLLAWLPWRGVLAVFGLAAISGGFGFARTGRGRGVRGTPASYAAVTEALANRSLWVLAVLFSLALGASLGVYTMLPLYLVSGLGWERTAANSLVAWSRVSGLVMVFAAGWLADRLGPRRTMAMAFGAAGVLTALLGLTGGKALLGAIFLQPVFAVCFFPVGFAVLSAVSPLGVSLVIPVAIFAGAGGIPTLIGVMAEQGSFAGAMIVVGALIAGGAALTPLIAPEDLPRES